MWCLWHCCYKSYVRYECLPFGPKRSKGLLLYGHFMARFCAFFYSHQCGWASSSSSSSKAQWMMLLYFLILSKHACSFSYADYGSWKKHLRTFSYQLDLLCQISIFWTIFLFYICRFHTVYSYHRFLLLQKSTRLGKLAFIQFYLG